MKMKKMMKTTLSKMMTTPGAVPNRRCLTGSGFLGRVGAGDGMPLGLRVGELVGSISSRKETE